MPYPPNLCISVQSVGVFVGGYGIPAIPTPSSEFLPQNPLQVCLRKSSHRIHRIHRSFRRRIFSRGLHRIHRSFWRRRASHGFHRIHRFFFSASRFCVFREFCGKIVLWLRGYGRDALRIPSTEPIPSLLAQVLPQNSRNSQKLQAEDILPRISQNTQKLLAEKSLPQISQMRTDG